MLTEEQANQLRLEQYALEDAEIRYNKVQQQLEKYNTLLNTIKDNYNSYTPEQKARISAKMWDISAKYRELKDQSYKYSIAQYEAQQQIDYYNGLANQQPATQTRRRTVKPNSLDGRWNEPETPISEPITYTYEPKYTWLQTKPTGQGYAIYNKYANAFADGWTKGQTAYLRTLPSPYDIGYPQSIGRMQSALIREWVSPQQAYDFVTNWAEAHTP